MLSFIEPGRRTTIALALVTGLGTWALLAADAGAAGKIPSSNPLSGDEQAIAAGKELYFTYCVQCHGVEADGVAPRWGHFAANLRQFWRGYSEFAMIVAAGRPEKKMPPWGEYLDGNQIAQIGAFLETLAEEGAKWDD